MSVGTQRTFWQVGTLYVYFNMVADTPSGERSLTVEHHLEKMPLVLSFVVQCIPCLSPGLWKRLINHDDAGHWLPRCETIFSIDNLNVCQ